MKHRRAYGALVIWMCFWVLGSSPRAQDAVNPARIGLPQDWTQHHILFTRDALSQNPELISGEPRIGHQIVRRWLAARPQALQAADAQPPAPEAPDTSWTMPLGLGRIAPNMFPAKYSFNVAAPPDCANDYVAFGLNRVGGANQATLIAFNNLYTGTSPAGLCSGATPTVLFAYNTSTLTAGRILTSTALSLDGKKIAFVESGNTAGNPFSRFHVVTWATGPGNGTSATVPAVPGIGNTATMTTLTFASALDTRSSPWIDYNTDSAYVGADDGKLYKILNVFNGTPTLAGGPWPVTLANNVRISAPVLDRRLGTVFVGAQNGIYYSVSVDGSTVKSIAVGRSGATNPGILAPPMVDISNGTSFVVSSNDGTSGVFVEMDSATMTVITKGRIGLASHSTTAVSLFQPAFSDSYFNDPSTGVARLCGTGPADITPYQYAFSFTGRTMNAIPASSQLLTSTTARCTGWTEFFNPNVGAGGTDFFFFGLTADCTGAGTSGCVVARNADGTLTTHNITGGPTGVVIDNFSTADQAANIYFTGATAPNTAYKLTQNGLN